MTTAQCIAGTFWAACALDLFQTYGWPGVVAFAGLSALIGGVMYRHFFRKGYLDDT